MAGDTKPSPTANTKVTARVAADTSGFLIFLSINGARYSVLSHCCEATQEKFAIRAFGSLESPADCDKASFIDME
jgi:hypothetical protein